MIAQRLNPGDTIGIICTSHVAAQEDYRLIVDSIERLGYRVKLGENIFRATHGYLASEQERADDLNRMVADDTVKMVLFGGGWGASEILPLVDFENIRRHPKLFSSYSDGTSILDTIYAQTGLVTYYGQGAGEFREPQAYDLEQFSAHFAAGRQAEGLSGGGQWRCICPGVAEGILIGGYTINFALLVDGPFFRYDPQQKHLFFFEDYYTFNSVAAVSMYLSHIEQNPFIETVSGLIFGHYSFDLPQDLIHRLERFGEKHHVPVAYCDDFGHYAKHAILPIGVPARLDAEQQLLQFGV